MVDIVSSQFNLTTLKSSCALMLSFWQDLCVLLMSEQAEADIGRIEVASTSHL